MKSFFAHRQAPEDIMHHMFDIAGNRPVALAAIEELTEQKEMEVFFNAFVLYTEKRNPAASRDNVSKRNGALIMVQRWISDALQGFDSATKQKWKDVMDNTEISEAKLPSKSRYDFTIRGHHLPHILNHRRSDDFPSKRS